MYPMSMSPEGVTDDEITAASMSETDTSLLNSASLPAMDDDQSESNSENNNDSAAGKQNSEFFTCSNLLPDLLQTV